MKDYKMINEAIATAEDLLKSNKQNYENCVCNATWDIKYQICDYIYNQLSNANFPDIPDIRIRLYAPPIESYEIYFDSADYGCDGQHFQYQLFIKDCIAGKVSRIYFNSEDYYEDTMQPIEEITLLVLIKGWKSLKAKLSEAIDKAYQQRINKIKQEADRIKKNQEILKSFKL